MPNRGLSLAVCLGLCCFTAWSQQYTVTTLAGNGSAGFADGGDPTAVQFNSPNAIAIDSKGVLYIADTANNRIRTISGSTTATVAGNGTAGITGNGAAATNATLFGPGGILVDSTGNIYIADTVNNVVRKVAGGTINNFAGTGNAGYSGDLGPAIGADLQLPTGLALDSAGNVYIADSKNNLIRKVDKNGVITSYIGGTGPTAGRLSNPTGLWMDASNTLYIADTGNRRIVKFAGSTFTVVAGNGSAGLSGDGGPATSAAFSFPRGVTVDSSGNVYVADTQNHVIRLLTPAFPTITAGGVGNAASFAPRLSPGALASVFGSGFGSVTAQPNAPLPSSVSGVSVNVNGTPSPIYYLSPTQINFQVPWEAATGTANVTVSVNGGASNSVSVPVGAAAPGLFYLPGGAAIVQNSDYSLNDPSNPAARGSTIIAYLTGSGPVSPAQSDGVPASATALVSMTSTYSAKIGSATAQVTFAGMAPTFIGLVQMNIAVPSTLTPGVYPLSITVGSETANSATIAVK